MKTKNCQNSPNILIIGSGAAGISAASKLVENNFKNVIILEAENRIGGRIHSVSYGDAIIDLGAEACHGDGNNIVYDLAKDFDVLDETIKIYQFYHSSGQAINQKFYLELLEIVDDIFYEEGGEKNVTMGDYISKRYNKIILKRYGDEPEKLKIASDFIIFAEKFVITDEGTFTWFSSSSQSDYEETDGNQEILWKGTGYKTILDILMKKFPDCNKTLGVEDKIILNKDVVKIIWDDNENGEEAIVLCSDNSSYIADHVIVTQSLGVLKNVHKTLFQPALPQRKLNTIEDLGIEAVGKIFLHFSERWWSKEHLRAHLIWNEDDIAKLSEAGNGQTNQSWLTDFVGLYEAPNNPNVLLAWLAGPHIIDVELLSDEIITEGLMSVIHKFFKHEYSNIPQPTSIIRFNWFTNPHFLGSYSFQTVKSRVGGENGQAVLSEPVPSRSGKNVLLFAGEATSHIHYATVTGAIESGFREANRIIDFYKAK